MNRLRTDALATWRHCTLVLRSTSNNGVAYAMNAGDLANAEQMAEDFPGFVFAYSDGMCNVLNHVKVVSDQVVQAGTDTTLSEATFEAACLAHLGNYYHTYDTMAFVMAAAGFPDRPFGAAGLTFGPVTRNGATSTGICTCYVNDAPNYLTASTLKYNLVHEWMHAVIHHLSGHQGFAMPNIDLMANYRWTDGTPWTSQDVSYERAAQDTLRAFLTGQIELTATGQDMGCTAAAWSSGTPRHP